MQLAFRLCCEAQPDDIVVSGLVRELCKDDAGRFVALRERQLKGFADTVPVFRVEWRG